MQQGGDAVKGEREFVRDFQQSHGPVFDVALWLRREGYDVRIAVPELRPTAAVRWQFSDSGDIECIQRVEVKCRNLAFTSAADCPFSSIFVDEVYKVDERLRRVLAYAIVNQPRTHVAVIRTATRPQWGVQVGFDERQHRECKWYTCPRELAWYGAIATDSEVATPATLVMPRATSRCFAHGDYDGDGNCPQCYPEVA